MSKFTIDFFELSFLAEACVPPSPIARAVFWDKLCNEYYHQMTSDERKRMYDWLLTRINDGRNLDNLDIQHFLARYDPDNQYRVYVKKMKPEQDYDYIDCYMFKDEQYHTNKSTTVLPEVIKKVEKISTECKICHGRGEYIIGGSFGGGATMNRCTCKLYNKMK